MEIDIAHLKESNVFLNDLFENVTSGIFLADREPRIHNFNNSFKTLFHKTEDAILGELCGNALGCVFHVDEAKDCGQTTQCDDCQLRKNILRSFTERVPVYKERLDRSFVIGGKRIQKHFIFTTKYVTYKDQEMILVIFDDITEIEEARLQVLGMYEALQKTLEDSYARLAGEASALLESTSRTEELMQEIHHRVGNNLQIILSLVNLQMQYAESTTLTVHYRDLERRILTIRTLYDHLIQDGLVSRIRMKDYLAFLARDIHGSRIVVDCADVHFPLDLALPLGLIVNELLVNSKEHAGCTDKAMQISLAFQLDREQGHLVLEDNGCGYSLSGPRHFGLRIVELLVRQVHGTLSVQSDQGSRTTITFPLRQ